MYGGFGSHFPHQKIVQSNVSFLPYKHVRTKRDSYYEFFRTMDNHCLYPRLIMIFELLPSFTCWKLKSTELPPVLYTHPHAHYTNTHQLASTQTKVVLIDVNQLGWISSFTTANPIKPQLSFLEQKGHGTPK